MPSSGPRNLSPHPSYSNHDYLEGDSPREGERKGGVEDPGILARLGGQDAWGSAGKTSLTARQSGRSCPRGQISAPPAAMGIPRIFLLCFLGSVLCLTGTTYAESSG